MVLGQASPSAVGPTVDEPLLASALALCLASAGGWSGLAFRSARLRFASREDLLTGSGALRFGGRFNGKASFAAVYASTDDETADAEVRYYATRFGWRTMLPRALVGVEVRLALVLNLIDVPTPLAASGVDRDGLLADWEPVQNSGGEAETQRLGRLARQAGFEGLLAPSARRAGGVNLVYFPDRLRVDLGSTLQVINAEDLPEPRRASNFP